MQKLRLKTNTLKRPGLILTALLIACAGTYLVLGSHATNSLVGDLNNDGTVNIVDLSMFLSHWQSSGSGLPEDFNSDGVVNIVDLSVLLSHFGSSMPAQPADITGLRQDTTWAWNGSQWIAQITAKSFGAATNYANALLPDDTPLDTTTLDIGTAGSPNPVDVNPATPNEIQRQATAYGTYINAATFTAPITIVPANTPLTPVDCTRGGTACISQMREMTLGISTTGTDLHGGFPIPDSYSPPDITKDTDAEAIFYEPDYVSPCNSAIKGRFFEAWKLQLNPNYDSSQPISASNPKWTTANAGRVVNVAGSGGHYANWTASGCNYTQPGDPNSTYQLSSWGVLAGGTFIASDEVSREDCVNGIINHEIGLEMHSTKPGHRWPAQRDDGSQASWPVQEGMRLRFPANMAKPAFNNRLESMLFDAAQKYGLIVDDNTSSSVTIRVEPVVNGQAATECAALYDGQAGYNVLAQFPWNQLQVLATGSDASPNGQ